MTNTPIPALPDLAELRRKAEDLIKDPAAGIGAGPVYGWAFRSRLTLQDLLTALEAEHARRVECEGALERLADGMLAVSLHALDATKTEPPVDLCRELEAAHKAARVILTQEPSR